MLRGVKKDVSIVSKNFTFSKISFLLFVLF